MAFVKVEGIIQKTLGTKGFSLAETIRLNDGRSFDKYWTIWSNDVATIGDFVEATGTLSAKILKDWETKEDKLTRAGERIVDLAISDAKIRTLRAAEGNPIPEGFDAL